MINKKIVVPFIILLAVMIVWIVWGNKALVLNTHTVKSDKLPDAFDGFRIAHVSDLHNTEIGDDNQKLLSMLKEAEPDMIAITGDFIDSRSTNVEIALEFAEEAMKIAPCYYVTGNHESRVTEYEDLNQGLIRLGVVVLGDEKIGFQQENQTINLLGVNDPSFQADYLFDDDNSIMEKKLQYLDIEDSSFNVLLSHRPELIDVYAKYNIDLVLSGHAHGGQFRLPIVGGIIAPNQGLLPKYDSGLYTEGNTNLVVSRGIGNSIFPFRFNNRPELIIIELQHD